MQVFARSVIAMLALGLPVLLGAGAAAQDVGDVEAGHAFAREICAICHEVEGASRGSPHPDAPTFRAIANVPGMTATALFVVLRTPHREMPDLVLAPDEMRNVIAYILTLQDGN